MQNIFIYLSKNLVWVSSAAIAIAALSQPVLSQSLLNLSNADLDNIYHEDDNLPDDADVFPRLGRIVEEEQQTNCRATPWGQVVSQFSGGSIVEIDRRQVDRNGESWFHNPDLNCWIHDRRIDLL